MQSSPLENPAVLQDMLRDKLENLELLSETYSHAISALLTPDVDSASQHVERADPILERLTRIEAMLEQKGLETPPAISRKTQAVKELHSQLVAVLEKEKEAIQDEQVKLVAAKKGIRGYREGVGHESGTLVNDKG